MWMALVVSIYFRIWSEHPHKQRESIRWSRCALDIVWATRFRHFYPCNQYTGIAQVVHVRYIKEDTESLTRIFFVCSCSCSPFHPTWHHDRRWYVVFRGLETSWLQYISINQCYPWLMRANTTMTTWLYLWGTGASVHGFPWLAVGSGTTGGSEFSAALNTHQPEVGRL